MNKNEQIIVNKVWSAIVSHKNVRSLSKMDQGDLNYLPRNFIKTLSVWDLEGGWHRLPGYIQNDPIMRRYMECHKHKPSELGCDTIDGPGPRIIDCPSCVKEQCSLIV